MTTKDRRQRLIEKILSSKEYREAFVEEHIYTGIPFQIQALREEKPWSQAELGKEAGMAQSRISKIENPSNGELNNIATLLKIAHAFHIGLMVRFVPISEILEWELNLSPDSRKAISFEDDPYFKAKGKQKDDNNLQQYGPTMPATAAANNEIPLADLTLRDGTPFSQAFASIANSV